MARRSSIQKPKNNRTPQRGNGEGSVYKQMIRRAGDRMVERWVAQVIVDGQKHRTIHKTEAQAKSGLRKLQAEIAADAPPVDGNMTVAQLLDRWRTRSLAGRELTPKTIETYDWCISRIKGELGGRRLRRLDVNAVESALDRMALGDDDHPACGQWSLVKIRSVLGQALDYGMKRKLASSNPCRLAEIPAEAKRPGTKRALTVTQAQTLFQAFHGDRLEALFVIMLTVGLRPGEAAGLTWDNIDLKAGRIAIRHGVRVINNRAVLAENELKTERSRRTIDLPTYAAAALRRHAKKQKKEQATAARWEDDRLVFASNVGTVLEPRNVARALDVFTKRVGFGHWSPNELRHSAASILSAAGVPLEQIADLLGHTNTRMLEQTYRHAVQPAITAAVQPMNAIIKGNRGRPTVKS